MLFRFVSSHIVVFRCALFCRVLFRVVLFCVVLRWSALHSSVMCRVVLCFVSLVLLSFMLFLCSFARGVASPCFDWLCMVLLGVVLRCDA